MLIMAFNLSLYLHLNAGSRPIVILPGFGNCSADYASPFGDPSSSLLSALKSRGFKAYVVPLDRKDWFKVARALLRPGFWSASLTTDPGYSWYLDLVHETVKGALKANPGSSQVDLIGHSAGGWLARAYLGDTKYFDPPANEAMVAGGRRSNATRGAMADSSHGEGQLSFLELFSRLFDLFFGFLSSSKDSYNAPSSSPDTIKEAEVELEPLKPSPFVRSIVTLGTPQRPAGKDKGKRDMTGGALTWVHKTYPGAFFSAAGIKYVTVGGRTVRGSRLGSPFSSTQVLSGYQSNGNGSKGGKGEGEVVEEEGGKRLRTPQEYAYDAYSEVSGEGEGVEGDAVVPLSHVFLNGSSQVLLDGVWHSMSRVGTFEEKSAYVWYGSDGVVDEWLKELAAEL